MTVTSLSHRESRRDMSVSHGCPDPTRPDPSVQVVCGASVQPSINATVGPSVETATMDGLYVVHWWFGPVHPTNADDPSAGGICAEYAMPDWVLDDTNGTRDQVTCPECLDWMHA